jgi:hypothetical protein
VLDTKGKEITLSAQFKCGFCYGSKSRLSLVPTLLKEYYKPSRWEKEDDRM